MTDPDCDTEAIDRLFLELSQFTRATTRREANLAMLVVRLARRLPEDDDLRLKAFDYIKRAGLEGSALR